MGVTPCHYRVSPSWSKNIPSQELQESTTAGPYWNNAGNAGLESRRRPAGTILRCYDQVPPTFTTNNHTHMHTKIIWQKQMENNFFFFSFKVPKSPSPMICWPFKSLTRYSLSVVGYEPASGSHTGYKTPPLTVRPRAPLRISRFLGNFIFEKPITMTTNCCQHFQ